MNLKTYTLFFFVGLLHVTLSAQITVDIIDFEEFSIPLDTSITASATNTDSSFFFNGLEFPSQFNPSYGGLWTGGWALSTSRNDSIKDFTNLFGSASGGGFDGSDTYMVGQNGAYILLPENTSIAPGSYSNLAYTVDVLLNGSSFSNAFGTDSTGADVGIPDSLVLVMNYYLGEELVSSFDLILADYTSAPQNDFILDQWDSIVYTDSPPFIESDSVVFNLVSSQSGMFGNNTPDFFVIDNFFVIEAAPLSVNETNIKEVNIYPNPTRSFAQFSDVLITGEMQIFDNLGRLVHSQKNHQAGSPMDMSSLNSGLYHIFLSNDSEVVRGTIMKE